MNRLMTKEAVTPPRQGASGPEPAARRAVSRWKRPVYAPALLVFAGLTAGTYVLWMSFNAPPGTVGREFPFDLLYYYYPMMELAAERLSAGEVPLWNPYQCCGVPLLATAQVAVFYPGTWLALVMPAGRAIQVLMFGQVLLGGVFAAMFFRALRRSHFAAGIGGLLFIFACLLGQTFWPPEVSTIIWMPFLFWAVERFLQDGRTRWWAAFTFGTTMQILAGYPQFLVYTFYLLVPYTMGRVIQLRTGGGAIPTNAHDGSSVACSPGRPPRPLRRCLGLAFGAVLAVGLAAVQLLPTAELVRETARGGRLTEETVHYLEIQRERFFDVEHLFTNMFDPSPKMITFDFPDGSGYLGLAVPFAALLGLLLGRYDARVWFFAVAAGVFFVLSFGYSEWSRWTYELYAALPTGNMFRTPGRLLVLTYFSLIALAVFGLDHGSGRPGDRQPLITLLMAGAVTAAAALYAVSRMSTPEGLHTAMLCVAAVMVAMLFRRLWPVRLTAQAVLAVLILRDLAGATAPYGSLRDIPIERAQRPHWGGVSPIPSLDLEDVAAEAGLERVAMPWLRPTKLVRPTPHIYSMYEYEPLLPKRWSHINRALGGDPGWTMSEVDPRKHGGIYDLASVRHLFLTVITPQAEAELRARDWGIHDRYPRPAPPGVRATYECRESALPRAYLVSRWRRCTAETALERVAKADFDYHTTVLLEEDPGIRSASEPNRCVPARIVSYAPERVVIEADASGDRILVLTDTAFPGWRASVDGRETPVLTANYLFRAVVLPPGRHQVVFEYRPRSLVVGSAVSLASLLVFGAVIGLCFVSARRSRPVG